MSAEDILFTSCPAPPDRFLGLAPWKNLPREKYLAPWQNLPRSSLVSPFSLYRDGRCVWPTIPEIKLQFTKTLLRRLRRMLTTEIIKLGSYLGRARCLFIFFTPLFQQSTEAADIRFLSLLRYKRPFRSTYHLAQSILLHIMRHFTLKWQFIRGCPYIT